MSTPGTEEAKEERYVETRSREHLAFLRRLRTAARRRDQAEAKLATVYAEVSDLYMEGRGMYPQVPIPEMAAAAGVSTDAVNKALRKSRGIQPRRHMNGRGVIRP